MREIKFRAWHKEKNIMSDEFSFYDFDVEYFIPNGWSFHHMIIMQYTGLKDKNGKEIFEGDVCKKTYGSSTPIFAVEYHEARCAFIMQDGYNELLYTINPNMIEIIGNIYENPELLGGVK